MFPCQPGWWENFAKRNRRASFKTDFAYSTTYGPLKAIWQANKGVHIISCQSHAVNARHIVQLLTSDRAKRLRTVWSQMTARPFNDSSVICQDGGDIFFVTKIHITFPAFRFYHSACCLTWSLWSAAPIKRTFQLCSFSGVLVSHR